MFLRGFLCPDDIETRGAVEDLDRAGSHSQIPHDPGSGRFEAGLERLALGAHGHVRAVGPLRLPRMIRTPPTTAITRPV